MSKIFFESRKGKRIKKDMLRWFLKHLHITVSILFLDDDYDDDDDYDEQPKCSKALRMIFYIFFLMINENE
jgi:hypothetical protein